MHRLLTILLHMAMMLFPLTIIYLASQHLISDWQFTRNSQVVIGQTINVEEDMTGKYRRLRVTYLYQLPGETTPRIGVDVGYPGFIGEVTIDSKVHILYSITNPSKSRLEANRRNDIFTIALMSILLFIMIFDLRKEVRKQSRKYRYY